MNWALLFQLALNGVIIGTLYGVVAMCFVLIYKASRIVNFAQGEFLLIGAWVCWYILTEFKVPFVWGFLLTLVTLRAVPVLAERFGWGVAFAVLSLGPAVGTWAMMRLRSLPEAKRMASGNR